MNLLNPINSNSSSFVYSIKDEETYEKSHSIAAESRDNALQVMDDLLEHREMDHNYETYPKFDDSEQYNYNIVDSKKPGVPISEYGEMPEWGERMKVSLKTRKPRRAPIGGKWNKDEDEKLLKLVDQHGPKNWKMISQRLGSVRDKVQCLHRYNKVLKPGLQKGPWTVEEDTVLLNVVLKDGDPKSVKWSEIALHLNGRIGKQCRERWNNHVNPEIRKGKWSIKEDALLFEAQLVFGNRWTEIAKLLPGRTENNVKNRFHSASARKNWSQPINKRIIRNPDPIRIAELYKSSEELFGNISRDEMFRKRPISHGKVASSFTSNKKLRCVPFHEESCDGDNITNSFTYHVSSVPAFEPPSPIDTFAIESKLRHNSNASIDTFDASTFSPNTTAGLNGMTPGGFLDWLVDNGGACDGESASISGTNKCYEYKYV